ncbi:PREDICTED: transmembrane protein 234-like isoform X2 [Priapulus caudatus]|uniref:Transmembrane protein 234-like isoform X2 n=1 Tax=Priapulus caudatus TaxID=37621 RepID=A0ABM1DS66_PRICU|nr:PREDICTED: transmembrane protein 234-like isoform X2 [Priapulus caudatus]
MLHIGDVMMLCTVAVLWGFTNPLMKKFSAGLENIKSAGAVTQFLCELHFLMFNWKYMVSFLTNIGGSVLYYVSLSSADVSLASPITNALTFIVTIATSRQLGENVGGTKVFIGMLLVVIGVFLCVLDKS